MANPFKNTKVLELLSEYKNIWALKYLSALAEWDMEVYMPHKGAESHGIAMGKLTTMVQKYFLDEKFTDLVKAVKEEKNLTDAEKGVIRILSEELDKFSKFPAEFLEDFDSTVSLAHGAWIKAKQQNDYKSFEPHLEKIVELVKRKAEYIGYTDHPYDALLGCYESGLKTKEVEEFFDSIRPFLKDLLSYIKKSPKFKLQHPMELEKINVKKAEKLNLKLLNYFRYDSEALRLDTSSHPFSEAFVPTHARITTRYTDHDIKSTYTAVAHEFGHALYDLQSDPAIGYTPISGGDSLGLQESQSRFWENFVTRSKVFGEIFYNQIIKCGKNLKNYSSDDLYEYVNNVAPSLIRVEADEVTYHYHIMIRFEIEKGLIEGTIKVKDLPKVWNQKYKEYLGVEPKTDSEGVLQDIHWSLGSIGYFPTYSTGTVLSAVWAELIEKELGSLNDLISSKSGISKIKKWLGKNLHKYGNTYTFNDMVRKASGENFNTRAWKKYLETKYKSIY
jgi:carboxypeptidase Taq